MPKIIDKILGAEIKFKISTHPAHLVNLALLKPLDDITRIFSIQVSPYRPSPNDGKIQESDLSE